MIKEGFWMIKEEIVDDEKEEIMDDKRRDG
jgi:hypothetical protein